MSSYSFSNQFYQHWTSAPDTIRAAIVQELTDITTLLQTDTVFEEYTFSTHDLDAHLDDLYGAHQKQQAVEKETADKQAQLKAEAEQQRLDAEKAQAESDIKQAKEATDRNVIANLKANSSNNAIDETLNDVNNDVSSQLETIKTTTTSNISDHLVNYKKSKVVVDHAHSDSAIKLSLPDHKLDKAQQELIHELELQIDDYLTEQMMQMSENLKSWLQAEVSRQFNSDNNSDANMNNSDDNNQ